jgi:recombination protein RecT
MSNVATKQQGKKTLTISDHLQSDLFRRNLSEILPNYITPDRMVRLCMTLLRSNAKLRDCTQESFFESVLKAAKIGIEIDGRLAHLVPYGKVCTLVVDYKGLVDLMIRTGEYSTIHADKVCENDDFVYDRGEIVTHKIDFRKERGKPYAYYVIIKRIDGGEKHEVMSLPEVEAIRGRSPAGRSGPWVTDFDEMAKKTVFKRASKWCKMTPQLKEAVEHDESQYVDGRVTARQSAPVTTADDLTKMLAEPQQAAIAEASEAIDWQAELDAAMTQRQLEELRKRIEVNAELIDDGDYQRVMGEIDERLSIVMAE